MKGMLDVFKTKPSKRPQFETINSLFQYYPQELKFEALSKTISEIPDEDFRILCANLKMLRDKYSLGQKLDKEQPQNEEENKQSEKIRRLTELNSNLTNEKRVLENSLNVLRLTLEEKEETIKRMEEEQRNLVQNMFIKPIVPPKTERTERNMEESKTVDPADVKAEINATLEEKEKEINAFKKTLEICTKETENWKEKAKKYKERERALNEKLDEALEENSSLEEKIAEFKDRKKEDRKKIEELNFWN